MHEMRQPDAEAMDLQTPPGPNGIIGGEDLTALTLAPRLATGGRLVNTPVDGGSAAPAGAQPLFVVTGGGALRVVTGGEPPHASAGDTVIALTGSP